MGLHNNWSTEETEYLKNQIGTLTFKTIAKNLGRTETACIVKAQRLKLRAFKFNSELITVAEASEILRIDRTTLYRLIKLGEIRAYNKNIRYNSKQMFLKYGEVCEFSETYRPQSYSQWSEYEISRLYCLMRTGKTYAEIAEILGRTESAVSHKVIRIAKGEKSDRRRT